MLSYVILRGLSGTRGHLYNDLQTGLHRLRLSDQLVHGPPIYDLDGRALSPIHPRHRQGKTMNSKKTIFKSLTLAVALAGAPLLASPLQAQPTIRQPAPPSYSAQVGEIASGVTTALSNLDLTEAQKAQIKAIGTKYAPQVRAIIADKTTSKEQKRAALQTLRVAARAEVNTILTPAQRVKVKALRALVESEIKALVARISDEVNLTESQRTEIRAILQDAHLQASAIVTDEALSRLQKRESLQSLGATTRAAIGALLTGSQPNQLEAIAKEIRAELQKRLLEWRQNGGAGLILAN